MLQNSFGAVATATISVIVSGAAVPVIRRHGFPMSGAVEVVSSVVVPSSTTDG
jgi:hypothetical protein